LNDEHEIMVFEAYFLQIYPSFLDEFSQWIRIEEISLIIDLIQLHRIARNINKSVNSENFKGDFIDYNSLVDEILEISPHYNYNEPKITKKIKGNIEKSLVLTRNSSKFEGNFIGNFIGKIPEKSNENLKEKKRKIKRKINDSKEIGVIPNEKIDEIGEISNENNDILLPSLIFKDSGFFNWEKRSTILSPKPLIFESFHSFVKNNDTFNEENGGKCEEINKSQKRNVFGLSISQNFDDFWKEKK